jgi:hypothetical protein
MDAKNGTRAAMGGAHDLPLQLPPLCGIPLEICVIP